MGFTLDPTKVEGNLFKPSGKWMYTVVLDYEPKTTHADLKAAWEDWDLWKQARAALRRATDRGISGVIFREIPKDWTLVVLGPYARNEHPIMVKGGE